MHVLDALRVGGAERVAVNLACLLPRTEYETFMCTTREDGPFSSLLSPHVERISLNRRHVLDIPALRRFVAFNQKHDIKILHAHGSSLFFARLASLFKPHPAVIWHDHYGRYTFDDRPVWLYRWATRGIAGVIAVNHPLANWSRDVLGLPCGRVWHIPNFVDMATTHVAPIKLPGVPGKRIVCLANIRPQKDHPNLVRAMKSVVAQMPDAHLLLVGDAADLAYRDTVLQEISELGINENVSYLGRRDDVTAILNSCDVGVLGSRSEGLPLALLEYGASGLPTIATNVGECPEMLENGAAGILVPPASPQELADALLTLLASPSQRQLLGGRFQARIQSRYSPHSVIKQICNVYERVLGQSTVDQNGDVQERK
jgi:glycosyltransferase involved in cell wall biosynthesis